VRAISLLAGALLLAFPALGAAQEPSPAATPAPAAGAATPAPAATPATTAAEPDDAPMVEGPSRVSFEDGLRDGAMDGEHANLFGAKVPDPTVTTTAEYGRGYKQSFVTTIHHRRANTAVVGGFVVVILALGATAWAQSKSSNSGAINPPGPALFRF